MGDTYLIFLFYELSLSYLCNSFHYLYCVTFTSGPNRKFIFNTFLKHRVYISFEDIVMIKDIRHFQKIWLWRHQLLTWLNRKLTWTPSFCEDLVYTVIWFEALHGGISISVCGNTVCLSQLLWSWCTGSEMNLITQLLSRLSPIEIMVQGRTNIGQQYSLYSYNLFINALDIFDSLIRSEVQFVGKQNNNGLLLRKWNTCCGQAKCMKW